MKKKFKVGVLGATGMVGQRFITLLNNHPWFEVVLVAASPRSSGKPYIEAVDGRWAMEDLIPENIKNLNVYAVKSDIDEITTQVDFVFCALDIEKEKIREIENLYAQKGIPVISNNSAHRWTDNIPMVIPEINSDHFKIIPDQKKANNWNKGFIVVKSNCSIQSYIPALEPLKKYGIKEVIVSTYQAISGAGKTFESWPEMVDNIIPYIGGEEDKSEKEPMKVWGKIEGGKIINEENIKISASCVRVPALDGHMATVSVKFKEKPSKQDVLDAWQNFSAMPQEANLPFAPKQFLKYFEQDDRPQTRLDRDLENGMGISIGRLRDCSVLDYKFICLSHNTIRGAAGGAILVAEGLVEEGYIK